MEPEQLFIGSQFYITSVFMNNTDLYSGDMEGNIIKWDFDSRRPKIKWKAHEKAILKIEYLQTKNQIVSHGRDGYLKFWVNSENKFSEVNRMESNKYSFCGISISHSTNFEFICNPLDDEDHTIEIIEYPSNTITHHIYAKPATSLAINSFGMVMCISVVNEDILLVAYESGYIAMFVKFKYTSFTQVANCIICIATSENKVIVGTPENEIVVLQIDKEHHKLIEIKRVKLVNSGISSIAIRKDGKIFATAGWDNFIRVFSCKTYKQLVVLKWNIAHFQKNTQLSLMFNDENYLISGSDDKIICFWNIFRNK